MKTRTKREILRDIAQIPDVRLRCRLIRRQLELGATGQIDFGEGDLMEYAAVDAVKNVDLYQVAVAECDGSDALISRFIDDPTILARAFVQIYPDIFYMHGVAARFAHILKLRADLGRVLVRPRRSGGEPDMTALTDKIPRAVRAEIAGLDRERLFRQYLFWFSRDPQYAFRGLEQEIRETTDEYARGVLQELQTYCQRLFTMTFPDFVDRVGGFLFPSFHVRWWVDVAQKVKRVLNMGDTGTQKTAFAVVATHCFGCRKILVLCPSHARGHWESEINSYFRVTHERTYVLGRRSRVGELARSSALYTVVAYTAITDERVRAALKKVPFDAVIWDECHYGKRVEGSGASQRGLACAELLDALPLQYVLALSATPWENHPGELAAVATALRRDLFPDAQELRRSRSFDPRLLRELFAQNILEVELPEVVDLPDIKPKPWEDLFGAELIDMGDEHRAVYEFVRECDTVALESRAKVDRLLTAAVHPYNLEGCYNWPPEIGGSFGSPALSTKLTWIMERIARELEEGAKVVVGTGIYVEGIAHPQNSDDQAWVGAQLRKRFGDERVLILYGEISHVKKRSGSSERDEVVRRWREDPTARILLVSIRTCPDSINLSVKAQPGIEKLFVTTLSYPWVPWKQFLGRFWRTGLGVPMSYAVPVLRSTIDENLFRLVEKKWELQQLFRARVPLTNRELELFDPKRFRRLLAPDARSSAETVNLTGAWIRDCDERRAKEFLNAQVGPETNAERFARAFVAIQDCSAPGHIARFMKPVILTLQGKQLVRPDAVLDAGCGPLTLERMLQQPVFGVDMNESILRMGKELSPLGGPNSQVGYLAKLPTEWQHRFDLTVASLVVDWASLHKRTSAKMSIREAVLRELVRVTHELGRGWLTFTHRAMDWSLLEAWCSVLERNKCRILPELTGLVEATDHKEHSFTFWSICFSPEGHLLVDVREGELTLAFEKGRIVDKKGGERKDPEQGLVVNHVRHEQFVVQQIGGVRLSTAQAAHAAATTEQERVARLGSAPWRALLKLQKQRPQ